MVPKCMIASISLVSIKLSHLTVNGIPLEPMHGNQLDSGNRTIFLMVPEAMTLMKQIPSLAQVYVLTSKPDLRIGHGVEFNLLQHWQYQLEATNFPHWYDISLSPFKTKSRILKDISHSYWLNKNSGLNQEWLFERVTAIANCQ